MTGYIYDADGNRVSNGSITTWSCNPTTAQFQTQRDYVLDQGGEQMSEYAMQPNGTMALQHTNVSAAGRLIATYAQDSTSGTANALVHFYLDDPLGSRRAQTDYAGNLEQTCANLQYGDAFLTCYCSPRNSGHHGLRQPWILGQATECLARAGRVITETLFFPDKHLPIRYGFNRRADCGE